MFYCISRRSCLVVFLVLVFILYSEKNEANVISYPVDVSFLIVDLKFNEERGAQICEIQHGVPSGFKGHAMFHQGSDLIAKKLIDHLSGFFDKSWATINSFADPTIKKLLTEDCHWSNVTHFHELKKDEEFNIIANLPVINPTDLTNYHGFVFISPLVKIDRAVFHDKYPGVVLIDNAFYNYADNKYQMTDLLMGDPLTEMHKPKWGIYHKKDRGLADKINREIGSDILVIKPTNKYKGEGVIILRKEELKSVLAYLFNNAEASIPYKDEAYHFWRRNKTTEFIVEEFIEVEPITVPHLDGKLYSPTTRLAFLLFYNKQEITINYLGGYHTLPKNALTEPGSLNEQYKSYVYPPYFAKADPKLLEQAEAQIREVLTIIYQKLLGL